MNFAAMPKYCVNLARRTDRREHAEREFQKANLEVEFVTAIDAHDVILPELSTKAHEYYAKGNWACVLSHLSIIKRATSEYICVFEDDITLCENFLERVNGIDVDFDFDIFYLGGGCRESDTLEPMDNGYHHVVSMSGTWAYIMRNTVFEFFVRNITYNWGPDEFFSEVLLKRFEGVTSLPMMVTPWGSPSDIGGPTPA